MLRIGFDAKRLFNNFTGLGNYSRTVVQGLNDYFPDNQYFLFTPKVKYQPDTEPFFNASYNLITPKGGFKNIWRTSGCTKQIKQLKLDIYHGLSHELPLGISKSGAKSVVTIHDLIYKTYPHDFSAVDRRIYDYKFRYACENAEKIVAVSQSTKLDIEKIYSINPAKIEVVYQTCQSNFKRLLSDNEIETVVSKYKLPDNYLLYVGSVIERKNLLGILKALDKLTGKVELPLVVVGNGNDYLRKVKDFIAEKNLGKKVIFTSEISFIDLPAIYQKASLFIYPSFYEGFGIPVIESLWSRTPVITSNISSLPEAAGKGAYLCNPYNDESIAEGILKILGDTEYARSLVNMGAEHVLKFESKINAPKLMKIYNSLLSKTGFN